MISVQEGTWWQLPSPIDPIFVQAGVEFALGGSPGEEKATSENKVEFPGEEGEGNRVIVAVVKRLLQDVQEGWQQSWANQDTHLAETEDQVALGNWQNPHSCKRLLTRLQSCQAMFVGS